MADMKEVAGRHDRVNDAAVRNGEVLDTKGNVAAGAESKAFIKKMFGRKPVRTEMDRVVYQDGKLKFVRHDFYDTGTKKDGKMQLTEKRSVACVYKGGKVLSGKWPEGQEMPNELRARISRAKQGAEA